MEQRNLVLSWVEGKSGTTKLLIFDNADNLEPKVIKEISYLFDRSSAVSFVLISADKQSLDSRLKLSARSFELSAFSFVDFWLLLKAAADLFPEDLRLDRLTADVSCGDGWFKDCDDQYIYQTVGMVGGEGFLFTLPQTIEDFNLRLFGVLMNADDAATESVDLLSGILPDFEWNTLRNAP
jgi:hypothetical protein